MKTLQFTVTVEFEDNINDDNDIMEVAGNIANAIVYYAGGQGIAPENGDTYTKAVTVKPQFLDQEVHQVIA
jgi:hypothetical protein